jgi:alkanesulfonate monooxygenase SsuD/methylene tetrahydromethanopterin reductase-like flavin-dependent oxidoreductase (luciferase family)
MRTPLASGSVSLRLYPHLDRTSPQIVDELRAQGALAAGHGFDGVMTSEHHGGFAGYLPNPLQAAGWCLEVMGQGWAAACPLLLPLRPVALVAEEVAWLAARFPGRVGAGVAAGALPADFEIMDTDLDDLAARFDAGLERLGRALRHGDPGGPLANDPAIAACATHPVPIVSAASSATAAKRAARHEAGIILDSLTTPARGRELTDAYRAAGGTGPCILIRRAWVGEPWRERVDAQVEVYRSYAGAAAAEHWGGDELQADTDPDAVAAGLLEALRESGCDALNIRVHVPGVSAEVVREQIVRVGDEVVPAVRARLGFA